MMIKKITQLFLYLKKKIIWLLIGGVVLAAGSQVIPQPTIPADLQLKCDKADILETYQKGDNIEYAYRTNTKIPKLDNEVKRTNTTLTRLERDNSYKVKQGDSLDKIAKELNLDKKKIRGYKSGNPDILYLDEVIDLGSKQYSVESGHSQYFDGKDWYEVKFGTTTREMYNRQIISFVRRVFAADTGWKSPAANETSGWSENQWTLPERVYSADGQYATASTIKSRVYYNFTLGVPAGATIDGIEVGILGDSQNSVCCMSRLSHNGGTNFTSEKTTDSWSGGWGSWSWKYLGGSSDTWGRIWSSSEFSDANFRADFKTGNPFEWRCDHIQVKVYYTEVADRRIIIIQ